MNLRQLCRAGVVVIVRRMDPNKRSVGGEG
jgi:hypothetical protein